MEAAVTAIEARDPTTGGHSHRVAELTKILLDESEIPTHWYNIVADLLTPFPVVVGGRTIERRIAGGLRRRQGFAAAGAGGRR